MQIKVNDRVHTIDADPDTPLLYVLADDLGLKGPRFGCGLAQCGSCSVLMDGKEIRSCVTPVSSVGDGHIVTLEGLPQFYAATRKLAQAPARHPVQQAFIDEQAPQCGYCYNGITVKPVSCSRKIRSRPIRTFARRWTAICAAAALIRAL